MEHITILINSYLPEPHASLLLGILFGKKLEVTQTFYDNLKKVGLIHIVVLSGMNITLLSSFVIGASIHILGRRLSTILTIVCIVLFVLFVGIQPPLIRASIMGILSLVGLLLGRKTLALYTLFLSAIIMILIWHEWITSISFHLSFGATLGIILFGNVEGNNTIIPQTESLNNSPVHTLMKSLYSYIDDELRVTLSAQIFTVPLIFFYFRQISFIAPLANILISFIIAPLMIIGLITVAVGSMWWYGGFVLSWICYGLIQWLVWIVEWLSKIPYGSVTF